MNKIPDLCTFKLLKNKKQLLSKIDPSIKYNNEYSLN